MTKLSKAKVARDTYVKAVEKILACVLPKDREEIAVEYAKLGMYEERLSDFNDEIRGLQTDDEFQVDIEAELELQERIGLKQG
jgi:hypothetical protein